MILELLAFTKTKTYKLKNFNYLIQEVDSKTEGFLLELKKQNDTFNFFPALEGLTSAGKNLNLGFSCYALKIFFILGLWEKLDSESKKSWKNYISDFQINKKNPSENLFIDTSYLSYYQRLSLKKLLKNTSKKILNLAGVGRYITDEEKLKNSLRAETKQAISTLNQINEKSKFEFFEFNNNTLELESYLNSLDWSKPWSAGGQFSALCLFSKINNSKEGINLLRNFSSELVDKHTGFYFKGDLPNSSETVNGAMKVVSGLDWIDEPVHYPEKLIDMCLKTQPKSEGCDLVDIVYVIYKASKLTNYKKKEIVEYCKNLVEDIYNHYHPEKGGFSYFINKSQTEYYGVQVSKGVNTPDLHGTLLLVWALSMLVEIFEENNIGWKILKP